MWWGPLHSSGVFQCRDSCASQCASGCLQSKFLHLRLWARLPAAKVGDKSLPVSKVLNGQNKSFTEDCHVNTHLLLVVAAFYGWNQESLCSSSCLYNWGQFSFHVWFNFWKQRSIGFLKQICVSLLSEIKSWGKVNDLISKNEWVKMASYRKKLILQLLYICLVQLISLNLAVWFCFSLFPALILHADEQLCASQHIWHTLTRPEHSSGFSFIVASNIMY